MAEEAAYGGSNGATPGSATLPTAPVPSPTGLTAFSATSAAFQTDATPAAGPAVPSAACAEEAAAPAAALPAAGAGPPADSGALSAAWRDYESVFTNTKAGMEGIDKDRIKRIVYEMSKDRRGDC